MMGAAPWAPGLRRVLRLVRAPRLRRDRRGLTAMEFGLIAMPLCLLLFAVVEIGLAVRMRASLQYAATQAARCAVVNATLCGTTDAIKAYAVAQSMGLSTTAASFTVTTATCGRQVSGSMPFPVMTSKVMPQITTVTARSCYPI